MIAGDSEQLFCRIYVDHHGPSDAILSLVGDLLGVAVASDASVRTDKLDICIDHGDSWPSIAGRDYSDWTNWKYSLEVGPMQATDDALAFAEPLKDLLSKLSRSGVKAVPSCNYEELLAPWNLVNA